MRSRSGAARTALFVLVAMVSLLVGGRKDLARGPAESASPTLRAANFGAEPLRFEANVGQTDPRVRYVARRHGAALFLTDEAATLAMPSRDDASVLTLKVAGGRRVAPSPTEELVTKTNYFLGNDPSEWRTDVPSFGRVTYQSVLDGVDLVYHGEDGQLEYDFIVAPGTDPATVAMDVGGAKELELTPSGDLTIRTSHGELVQPRPRVFQRDGTGKEEDVRAGYRLVGADRVAFEVASYDRSRPLVIDPVISYARLLGGSANDGTYGLAVNGSGEVYVGGQAVSANFPVTNGSTRQGTADAFVAKLNATGGSTWVTYFGGSGSDIAFDLALDSAGTPFISGRSESPTLPAMLTGPANANGHAFVAKLTTAGAVSWSTYVGGTGTEESLGIAVDGSGTTSSVYITGSLSFTTMPSALNSAAGGQECFVSKLDGAGTIGWSVYVGGSSNDSCDAIAVDSSANVYVAGSASSPSIHASAPSSGHGGFDAFATKVTAAGVVQWSTLIGGTAEDTGRGIAVDGSGNVFVHGFSQSASMNGGAGPNAGDWDAFLARLSPTGVLAWSKFVGGSGAEWGLGLTLDAAGSLYAVGHTCSANLAGTGKAASTDCDAMVNKFSATGTKLYTYRFGATYASTQARHVTADAAGNVYTSGYLYTAGATTDFPYVPGPVVGAFGGNYDGFVVKIGPDPLALSPASPGTRAPGSTTTFTASGGAPPYTFALPTNGSTGGLSGTTATTTVYTAGTGGGTGATDTIRVTDSKGVTATVNITVGPVLKVMAGATNLVVGGSTNLTVSGGSGSGYVATSAPCGSIVATSATVFKYTATTGPCSGTIVFKDSLNKTASTPITVGSALAITGATSPVPPRTTLSLDTAGGSGTITWTLLDDESGASLSSDGVYTAGTTGNVTDTIRATDAAGGSAQVEIDVSAGVSITSATSAAPLGTIHLGAVGGSNTGFTWAITTATPRGTITGGNVYKAGTTGGVTESIRVTDSLGNVAFGTITIGAALRIAAPTNVTVPPRGSHVFTAQSGSGGYVFSVDAPPHGTIGGSGATATYTAGTTGNLNDTIKVKDSNGATASAQVHIGPGVSVASSATSLSPKGAATLTASGGNGSFPIASWTLAPGGSGGTLTPAANGTASFKAGATGGVSDTITAKDSLGNTGSIVIAVGGGLVIDQGTSVTVAPRKSVTFTAHGGDSSHPYAWSFVTAPAPSGGTLTSAGVYKAGTTGSVTDKVRVTDVNGNTADITVNVSAGVSIVATPAALGVAPLARIQFSASGGSNTGFSWTIEKHSGGDASLGAASGEYRAGSTGSGVDVVRVTDDLGNTRQVNVTVGAPLSIARSHAKVPPRGSATFTASAGQPPYTFAIQTASSGGPTVSSSGAYKAGIKPSVTDVVKVTDANGATAALSIDVGVGLSITPSAPAALPLGTIDFDATGGSGTGFVWSVPTSGSGGSINATSGAYVAGGTASTTDQVRVVDSLGNFALVNVSVGGGVAIHPASGDVAPRGSIEFAAQGGTKTGYVWSLAAKPSGGSINVTTGKYTAGPTPNVTDRVRVVDSGGNAATVDVRVGAALEISPASGNVAPKGTIAFTAAGGSGVGISFALVTSGSGATIADGTYAAGGIGSTTDVVRATDSLGNTSDATITVGAALRVSPSSASVPPGGAQTFSATGGAGDYVFSLASKPSGGTISSSGSYVAGRTANVTDVVRVTDDNGVTIDVSVSVGAGITISPTVASVGPGGAQSFTATGGSGGFVWSLTKSSSGGSIDPSTGAYTAGTIGSTFDTVTVTDSVGNTASANVSVGGALVITPAGPSVAPRGAVAFSAAGGTGTYAWSITTNGSGGAIEASSGAYVAGQTGGVTDVVAVTDGAGATVSVDVHVGGGVRITPEAATAKPKGEVAFTATGGSGSGYVWTLAANPSGGAIAPSGVYTAGATVNVMDTVRVTDSLGNVGEAAVSVTADGITPIVAPPAFDVPPASSDDCAMSPGRTSGGSMSHVVVILATVVALVRRRRRSGAYKNETRIATGTQTLADSVTLLPNCSKT